MKYSIVMTHVNRERQLDNTLFSISLSKVDKEKYEVIIVDDNSTKCIENTVSKYFNTMNIKYLKLKEINKNHYNSCVPYNYGFSIASGENIIIQNAECLHYGDLLNVCENLQNLQNEYYVFSCYSLSKEKTYNLFKIEHGIKYFEDIKQTLSFNSVGASRDHSDSWYNHPIYRNVNYHFCSIISRKNLKNINGFDEEYKYGFDYDDNEILHRIKLANIKVNPILEENCFVIHQFHENSRNNIENIKNLNYNIFVNKTLKKSIFRANENKEILR